MESAQSIRSELEELLQRPENKVCADCGKPGMFGLTRGWNREKEREGEGGRGAAKKNQNTRY